jgi:hypothetical protein
MMMTHSLQHAAPELVLAMAHLRIGAPLQLLR